MSNKKLLTFEISNDGEEVEIHCNIKGAQDLISYIERMVVGAPPPKHDHLATPAWAGDELSEEKQGKENKLVNQVTIHLWKDELRLRGH